MSANRNKQFLRVWGINFAIFCGILLVIILLCVAGIGLIYGIITFLDYIGLVYGFPLVLLIMVSIVSLLATIDGVNYE